MIPLIVACEKFVRIQITQTDTLVGHTDTGFAVFQFAGNRDCRIGRTELQGIHQKIG